MFFLKTVRDGINMRILISCVMDANPVWMPWMLIAEHAMYKEDSLRRWWKAHLHRTTNLKVRRLAAREGGELISGAPRNIGATKNASPHADGAPARVRKDVAGAPRRLSANSVEVPNCKPVEILMRPVASHRRLSGEVGNN
jgi:hypothetical protein